MTDHLPVFDDVLAAAPVQGDLVEALAGCRFVVGTSARRRTVPLPERTPREAARELVEAAAQRLARGGLLVILEGLQPPLLIDPLRLIGKQNGITVKGNPQLIALGTTGATRKNGGRRKPGVQRASHILGVCGEKQIALESLEIRIRAAPTDKGRTGYRQTVMMDRVEYP